MRTFGDWSIRHKLTALLVAMASIAAISVAVPIGVFDYVGLRRAMARDLSTLAEVLARNSTAALAFRDVHAAQDVLQALRAESSVTAACIYTDDGKPFASYTRQEKDFRFVPPVAQAQMTSYRSGRLIQFRDIILDGEVVGTIYIESDLQRLDTRLREYSFAFLVTLLVTIALAFLIAPGLQRPISRPLVDLVQTTKAISDSADYSIRSNLPNQDEFGVLASEFNGMLNEIEKRDRQLRQHREQLEQEVASRTAALLTANTQLRRAEEKYRAIFEDAVIGIFQMTPEGCPLSINKALAEMHGYDSPEQFVAEIHNIPAQLFADPGRIHELFKTLDENGVVRGAEVKVYRRDHSTKWARGTMRAARDAQGTVVFYEGMVEDVTDRKVAEERVQFLAYYDALTALPNRTLLHDRLNKALASGRRRNRKIALLFLDLDRFKVINDSLGHTVGDLLLQDVAERLQKWTRAEDTVARLGGDEFVIVLTDINDVPGAAVAAERLMDAMAAEFIIQGRSFTVNCSIGISVFPEHGTDSETLTKNADAAMYCAKEGGRNGFRFFTKEMNAQVVERLTIEHDLRLALENKELFLMYQPQMDIVTGKIVGLEALLRWQHPRLGLVPPDRFIRVAENSGLIVPIGQWVLTTACTQARKWQDTGLLPLPVAVNVSAVQFRQEGFRELIKKVLHDTGLEPQYLELELTESLLLSNADMTFPVLQELKATGVKLAIDDFGTGYSSLSYLRQFPVHKLKIDRSFIQNVAVNPDDASIAAAIIGLGRSLNLKVIAEGVEDEAQMSFLRAHQCDEIQGYYFSRPLTVVAVAEKLARSKVLNALSASTSTG
jgi:diguanylate cyclase (GGDEF)-like protein/PAS domain S-box-containing protein